jgi:predicted acylesterase/phospholipase RssA
LSDSQVPVKAICLDGGGYLGLATASFLAETERHLRIRLSDEFNLFCGTSTGGIIALALANGMSAEEIVHLYRGLGANVFRNRLPWSRAWRLARGLLMARYSNKPLRAALTSAFGDTTLHDVLQQGRRVVVPAFCITTGSPRVFKTDHVPQLSRDKSYKLSDIALATSAAPTYFPIAAFTSPTSGVVEQYIDGGVFANNPALLALTEALGYLGATGTNIRLLSVSTPRDPTKSAELARPLTRWQRFRLSRGFVAWGLRLADLFIGSGMQVTHSAVNRVLIALSPNADPYVRCVLPTRRGLGLDIATEAATHTLVQIGIDEACKADVRTSIAALIGQSGAKHG